MTFLGHHTIRVQQGLILGIILFIVSEIFFFLSIFWAFFDSALAPTVELGCSWPPAGIQPIDPWELPLVNTVLLLSSGATVTWSHHSLIAGDRKNAIVALIYTIALALIFTGVQIYEYYNAPFTISDGAFGSCFFFGTGMHGLHVFIGTTFLSVGLYRLLNYHLTKHHHVGYEGAILYWHMVDVIWLILFIFFYIWGGGEPPLIKNSPKVLEKVNKQDKVDYKSVFASLDQSFIEWFVGFTDAEGCFFIKLSNNQIHQLMFQIGLHKDELPLLTYLKDKLKCGYITHNLKEDKVNFVISDQSALLEVLIPLFDSFQLNTTKYLDYLAFREVVFMRSTKTHLTDEGKEQIRELKASMNKNRSNYTLPSNHKVVVTFPWLLGLIEGDGCFSFNKLVPRLSIQLNYRQEYVLKAIQEFFGGLGNVRIGKPRSRVDSHSSQAMVIIEFNQIAFLRNVIIPAFKALTFLSKKGKDFEDWLICVEIYFSGRHTLAEGEALILCFKSRMNNNRLSTNPINQKDLLISQANVEAVFKLPAPYEVRDGARYISGTDKLVPESFPVFVTYPDGTISSFSSLSKCAIALGISRKPVREYLDTGTPYKNHFFNSIHPSFKFHGDMS